jgi:hypothetical protein
MLYKICIIRMVSGSNTFSMYAIQHIFSAFVMFCILYLFKGIVKPQDVDDIYVIHILNVLLDALNILHNLNILNTLNGLNI